MSCNFTAQELLQVIKNPGSIPGFVRSGWDEAAMEANPYYPHNEFIFKIFIGSTAYRFDFFISFDNGNLLNFDDIVSERGRLQVWLNDSNNEDFSDLPFVPVNEQYGELWDRSGKCYWSGFVDSCVRVRVDGQRADLSVLGLYKLEMKSLYSELERDPNVEIEFDNVTFGVALRNAILRYAPIFDVTGIPLDLGGTQPKIKWLGRSLAEILNLVCSITGTSYTITPDTHLITVNTKDTLFAQTGIVLTDSTVFDMTEAICPVNNLEISTDTSNMKTEIEFHYYEKYTRGLVDVGLGDTAVLGVGTFWDGREPGGKFYLKNFPNDVYTIKENQSAYPAQTLEITPAYTGADATGQEYVWTGVKSRIKYQSDTAVRTLAAIRGGTDNGLFKMNVHDDQNEYFSDQALLQAIALLTLSEPQIKGGIKTNNEFLRTINLRAGMGLTANLPITYGFDGLIMFYKITWKANGTVIPAEETPDGLERPGFDIDIRFSRTMTNQQAQMRSLLQKAQRTKIADDGVIEYYIDFSELLAIKTCYHVKETEKLLCYTNSKTGYTTNPVKVTWTTGGRHKPVKKLLVTNSRNGYTTNPVKVIWTKG